ncbi:piezo-type mechanosensitive ion channel component 2 isoform X2 [Patella vulgata]|uniref:piezo-type mechanosensitive ion channel component 2 isoform X2 n=1 Tax=Patella vulgata TaxID=6465 RepID=UPI0024A9E9B9|nr:piezo-type mechanosensitive ion channel component 2 isoform X2 [Patella vulgata]
MSTKATRLVCYLLFRILLPITLLAAAVVRFNGLSFLYAIFLLITPLLSCPDVNTIKGVTGIYLKVLIAVSSLATLTQIIFHVTLVAIATEAEPYGSMFTNCSTNEQIARQLAVQRLDGVSVVNVVRLAATDGLVLIISLVVFLISFFLLKREANQLTSLPLITTKSRRRRGIPLIEFVGEFILNLLIAASGIILPSALSAVYFASFLILATLWSFYHTLGRKFAIFRVFLLTFSGLHILALHLYQFQFFQEAVPHTSFISRLLGLTGIIKTDCNTPWKIHLHDDVKWEYYVNPGILLMLYWALAFESRHYCHKKDEVLGDGEIVRDKKRKKKRQPANIERQVFLPHEQEETGSIMFNDSAYGDPDQLEEELHVDIKKNQQRHLVDDGENSNYNTIEATNKDEQPTTSRGADHGNETDEEDVHDSSKKRDKTQKRSPLVTLFVYIMKHSYVLLLIAMMAWSITFHSWLTFVLLLGACILWMVPNSRKACLIISPLITFYAICLLIAQFIFSMNLKEDELPSKTGDLKFREIGLMRLTCYELALQVFFTLFFWLTMRQFMRERQAASQEIKGFPLRHVQRQTSTISEIICGYVWLLLCKYWIFVCAAMLLLISIQDVVVYRIIYMFLFLYFILAFQFSYVIWRATMFVFWWVVIVYSMAVLIMIYTYQFDEFPGYWRDGTGFSNATLSDIGLERYDTAGLFLKLLTPTAFVIIVILQIHYFHKPFLAYSSLNRYKTDEIVPDPNPNVTDYTTDETGGTTTDTESVTQRRNKRWKQRVMYWLRTIWAFGSETWAKTSSLLWRVAEVHYFKLVVFTIMVVAASEVSAVSAIYVILMAIFLPLSTCHVVLSHVIQFWTALVLLAKMLYQLRLVKTDYWITNCSQPLDVGNHSLWENGTEVDNGVWVGLMKISKLDVIISYYLRNYLVILLIIAFQSIVRYHQLQKYRQSQIFKPPTGVIFPEIKRENADKGIKYCLMYFANYFFYKYGLEICYITTATCVCIRVDAYAVLYAIFLGILLLMSRRSNARVWPIYTIILAVLLPIQYLSCIGFPLGLCLEYPWKHETLLDQNLEQWLFLPDYANSPHPFKLLADFFQLLFVCLQWKVFRIEMSSRVEEYGGGDNSDILPEVEANTPIPSIYTDFTTTTSSYLDVIKYAVFEYMFWVTLAIIFITGTTRINLFSMGYVIAVFCFMWYGQEFLLKPLRKLLRGWNILIGYTFFVLFAKACLQLVGCVYIKHLYENQCWLIQLLGINCWMSNIDITPPADVKCRIEEDNTGLAWDVVCFVFLLLQRRIYSCHYFRHVVDEIEAQHRLASRGAEYINRINIREVNRQRAAEDEILLNIKKKMKYLKDKQAKLKKNYVEPEEHYQAIRSGDYYLFDEESDEEEAPDQTDSLTLGKRSPSVKDVHLGPLQVVTTAMDSGAQVAIDRAASQERISGYGGSTSEIKGKRDDTVDDDDIESPPETAKKWGSFVITLLRSIANWFINLFNRISRNYRLVARKLEKEMKLEKQKIQTEKENLIVVERRNSSTSESDGGTKDAGDISDNDLLEVKVSNIDHMDGAVSSLSLDEQLMDEEDYIEDAESEFEKNQPIVYRLLKATYYVLVSRSELLCYFLMILNQMIYACLISLPLPLMVFLWGMLSIPRPSKRFWITVITYTEALVVIKYLFQFSFFPWNEVVFTDDPFWPPRIIGIEQKANYASLDLVLLLALFIHRSILKRYGLWKDADDIEADLMKAGEKELSPPTSPMPTKRDLALMEDGQGNTSGHHDTSGSTIEESGEQRPKRPSKLKEGLKKCVKPLKDFYIQVTQSTYVATVDVYAPMFLCDFITFIIVVFGYWAFGPAQTSGAGDVTSYLSENRVPVPFLVMLITQFVLIIIDRALFLRKNVVGKFVFQITLVILIHIWMFFVLPAVTKRSFYDNIPAQLWYFTKCIYFGLSAYQIRCGYPTRILGNFLTKKYNYLNLFLFKGFLAVPFLLELRALMDWIWTDTTLALGSWLQMEDIYANIFVLKCWRHAEATYPTPRGNKRKTLVKYGVGGLLLFVIIFIIWFPLVLFSFANTVYVPNPPFQCKAEITIAGYQPLLSMNAQNLSIRTITDGEYNQLQKYYIRSRSSYGGLMESNDASAFLSNYEREDITITKLKGTSTGLWGISPPSVDELIQQLKTSGGRIEFSLEFARESTSGASELISHQFSRDLDKKMTKDSLRILNNTVTGGTVNITKLFPRFMRLGSKGSATDVPSLLYGDHGIEYSNVSLELNHDQDVGNLSDVIQWWKASELLRGTLFNPNVKTKIATLSSDLSIITFNDRRAPAGFSIITGYGIIGLYVSFILLIGRFLRIALTGQLQTIMFRELPNVDKILQLCLNIYLVREMKEYRLEEDLYSKIVFLYRSPETLIKWTAYPPQELKLKIN